MTVYSSIFLLHCSGLSIPGRGSCTSRPSTRGSVLSLKIKSNSSSSLMSECLRIVSLEIPVGEEQPNNSKHRRAFVLLFLHSKYSAFMPMRTQCVFFSYRYQLQLVSYSGRRSDWLGFLQRESHSDGVFCGQLEPISPHRPGPPPESAVLVSFLR